ncbi:hypothetical protein AwDysgo_14690 [Bacteroidales bacterium]|nr:hypothetical protein AwDysgo_14690 [Bacteroidales bacterium]
MKQQHFLFFLLLLLFVGIQSFSVTSAAKTYKLSSPDGKLLMEITKSSDRAFYYSFTANGKQLIENSPLGFELEQNIKIPSSNWMVEELTRNQVNGIWKPLWGKRSLVSDCFNELVLDLRAPTSSSLSHLQIIARAYNDGIAFRYAVPKTETKRVGVLSELTAYNFSDDYTAWFYNGEYHNLGPEKLSESVGRRLPVMTIEAGKLHYMAVHEADLIDGQPLVLHTEQGSKQFTVSSNPNHLFPDYKSAWRVILYGSTPGLLVDSHIIELLNPDPSPDIDFSWVKPGIAVWDWRINGAINKDFTYSMSYPSWIRMVDFAAEQGFEYLVLDADWYGPEHEAESDPIAGDKAKDVHKLINYAEKKKIGIWLYLNDVGGRKYPIEETLKQYGTWGAKGVKYGFMNGSPEEKNHWTRKITALCA